MRVILTRGISGSGKSTHLAGLTTASSVICSADHYFMVGGVYKFDASQLAKAHRVCFRKFINTLNINDTPPGSRLYDILAVDNTNLMAWEIAPYVAAANAFGIRPEIITVICPSEIAHRRNSHGVPEMAVKLMAQKLTSERLPPFWDADFREVLSS